MLDYEFLQFFKIKRKKSSHIAAGPGNWIGCPKEPKGEFQSDVIVDIQ